MMINHPKRVINKRNRQNPLKNIDETCEVCNGRGYVLVASKNINPSSKVYERAPCQACAVPEAFSEDSNADGIENDSRALTGTGYLRNKKRRRKSSQ